LDVAALKRSSVSFFDVQKPETAVSRWARARTRAAKVLVQYSNVFSFLIIQVNFSHRLLHVVFLKVGKGLSKDDKAQKLALQHWLEAVNPSI